MYEHASLRSIIQSRGKLNLVLNHHVRNYRQNVLDGSYWLVFHMQFVLVGVMILLATLLTVLAMSKCENKEVSLIPALYNPQKW